MNDIPICGNVWPDHLIEMIRTLLGPAPLGSNPNRWKVTLTDQILVALNLYHTAEYLADLGRGDELRKIALEQLKVATADFVSMAGLLA